MEKYIMVGNIRILFTYIKPNNNEYLKVLLKKMENNKNLVILEDEINICY